MFSIGKTGIASNSASDVELYPLFGGRPVRQRSGLQSLVIALTLIAATAGATLAIASATEQPRAATIGAVVETGQASDAAVRTTGKADRLKPAFKPLTCDGVWGNEPLECLAQTV